MTKTTANQSYVNKSLVLDRRHFGEELPVWNSGIFSKSLGGDDHFYYDSVWDVKALTVGDYSYECLFTTPSGTYIFWLPAAFVKGIE